MTKTDKNPMCERCGINPRLKDRRICRDCKNKDQRKNRLIRMGLTDDTIEHPCECGCGGMLTTYYGKDGRVLNHFIYGHLANVVDATQECECGCGTVIDMYASGRRRHFAKGHWNRPLKLEGESLASARRTWSKSSNMELKRQVFAAYGNRCACPPCGETEILFLTMDHVHRDGASDRRTEGYATGLPTYRRLRQLGFPQDGWQILCWNCNSGRELNGGVCPHQVPTAGIEPAQEPLSEPEPLNGS